MRRDQSFQGLLPVNATCEKARRVYSVGASFELKLKTNLHFFIFFLFLFFFLVLLVIFIIFVILIVLVFRGGYRLALALVGGRDRGRFMSDIGVCGGTIKTPIRVLQAMRRDRRTRTRQQQ